MTANNIIERARISEVYVALGGTLKHGRGQAFWRGGDGFHVAFEDDRGVWIDHVTHDGGGVLALINRAMNTSPQESLRWLADFVGVPLESKPFTPQESAAWKQQREEEERLLPDASRFKRGAIELTEELLHSMKVALDENKLPFDQWGEIYDIEQLLTRLRSLNGAAMIAEYKDWQKENPGWAAGIVRAVGDIERREERALRAYLRKAN